MKKPWVLSYRMSAQRRLIRLGGCPSWSESSLGAQSFCWFCHEAAHYYHKVLIHVYQKNSTVQSYSLVKLLTSFFGVNFRISFSTFFSVGISFHTSSLDGRENVLLCLFLILSELLLLSFCKYTGKFPINSDTRKNCCNHPKMPNVDLS